MTLALAYLIDTRLCRLLDPVRVHPIPDPAVPDLLAGHPHHHAYNFRPNLPTCDADRTDSYQLSGNPESVTAARRKVPFGAADEIARTTATRPMKFLNKIIAT
jgi:hypothetical protein